MKTNGTKKLILIKPNGNHSNRLLQNLHFEVFCKEYNIEYHNPTLADIAKYYANPCSTNTNKFYKTLQIDLLGRIFHHSKIIKKVFSVVWLASKVSHLKFIRFDKKEDPIVCKSRLLKAFEKNEVVYVGGWRFRIPDLVEKYQAEITKKYSLKPTFIENNTFIKKINDLKSDNFILVGIHIRRGDYKKWKGGKYYYEDVVYKEKMSQISEKLTKQGKDKLAFILFSNESLNFEESENMLISNESWYIDHHIMSNCDYLIGPPSTFTLWASYIGKTKLAYIYSREENLDTLID